MKFIGKVTSIEGACSGPQLNKSVATDVGHLGVKYVNPILGCMVWNDGSKIEMARDVGGRGEMIQWTDCFHDIPQIMTAAL